MKKTYINPIIEVVTIGTQQMLAVSNQDLSNTAATKDGSGNYSNALGHDDDFDW